VAQLSYSYAASQVEIRPADRQPSPGSYVLCQVHLDRLSVPKGWSLHWVREPGVAGSRTQALDELADEIRRVGFGAEPGEPAGTEHSLSQRTNLVTLASRAHLRVVADAALYASAKTSDHEVG
jgi:hypothetical protein